MNNPIISIIVPCYNAQEFLRETLDCLKKQTLENWECVIVNDGSSDGTVEIAKEYVNTDNRYILVNKPNGGLADARNAGIKASHGKYILPLDADDLISPSYAETAISYLEKHPKNKIVYCEAEKFGTETGKWIFPDFSYEGLLWANPFFCSSIYRRSDYDKTRGYDANMRYGFEDWDFWLSFINEDDEVYKIPQTMFWYRKHGYTLTDDCYAHIDSAFSQLFLNHIDRYTPYLWQMSRAQYEVISLRRENEQLLNSYRFRIGKIVLSPLTMLKDCWRKLRKL